MSTRPKKVGSPGPTATRLDIEAAGMRISVAGPALAVIGLVALVGVIWLCFNLLT